MKKIIFPIAACISATVISLSALAGFTTSEFGQGKFSDGGSIGDILNNLLGTDGASQISLSDLAALGTALSSADSYSYPDNSTLHLFDSNNDGSISEQEFVDVLNRVSSVNNVRTTGNGKYAQAYATELGSIVSPISVAKIQAAIDAGNGYAVDSPQINTSSLSFSGTSSSHSGSLGLVDGLGNNVSDNGSVTTILTASHSSDDNATAKFDVSNGNLVLASSVDIQDLEAGVYTINVSSTDTNTNSYYKTTSQDVTLTVSNERGCIINNGITNANFDTNGDNSSIDGAKVTISGSHNSNDLLFIRTATKTTTSDNVSYSSFGVSGLTAIYYKSSGQLTFSGSTSLSNWISVFKKVGYIFDDNGSNPNSTRSLIFSLSDNVVYDHADNKSHFYSYEASSGIDFDDAIDEADNLTLYGLQGYLATITSAAEQAYIEPKLNGIGWIGGCDRLGNTTIQTHCNITSSDLSNLRGVTQSQWDNTTGHWDHAEGESYFYWVTGPERLEFIGEDTYNCSSSNYAERKQETLPISGNSTLTNPANSIVTTGSNYPYHNFQGCEPNNYRHSHHGENYLHVYANGNWNDYRNDDPNINGYLVEYGGMAGDPDIDLTENKTYNISSEGQYCAY